MHRSVQPLARLLACAAVPAVLVTGCSSGSAPAKDGQSGSAPTSAATATGAKYTKLPDPCAAISQATVKQMVPSAKDAGGRPVTASDPNSRGGCSWTGLDGYQYRWLDDSLQRFDALGTGSADDQARAAYQLAVQAASKTPGAKAARAGGIGDQATVVTWDANRDNTDYHYVTVVARSANAVVTVDFNGAGLQGDNKPKADEMNSDAQQAAREVLGTLR